MHSSTTEHLLPGNGFISLSRVRLGQGSAATAGYIDPTDAPVSILTGDVLVKVEGPWFAHFRQASPEESKPDEGTDTPEGSDTP